jgi:acyl carrier protein
MAAARRTSREEIAAVYPQVAQAIADALGRSPDEVRLDSRLIDDLNAESIDFLDIVFRLERAFQVKIPRGQIVENARGDLPEAEFARQGFVTDAGLARLRDYLDEVGPEKFRHPFKVGDIPLLFTVETFAKLVVGALRARSEAEPGAAGAC